MKGLRKFVSFVGDDPFAHPGVNYIDPGPAYSAFVRWDGERVLAFSYDTNDSVLLRVADTAVVIEQVQSMGMIVGQSVFDTVFWAGRFAQAAKRFGLVPRRIVKLALCGSAAAKDPNIRRALIDLFGGDEQVRRGGCLYGVSGDVWAALALAVTFHPPASKLATSLCLDRYCRDQRAALGI